MPERCECKRRGRGHGRAMPPADSVPAHDSTSDEPSDAASDAASAHQSGHPMLAPPLRPAVEAALVAHADARTRATQDTATTVTTDTVLGATNRLPIERCPDLRGTPEMQAAASIGAMARVAVRWQLTPVEIGQLLGGVSTDRWDSWRHTPPRVLPEEQATAVSLLLGIYAALHVLHPGPLADGWVQRPNTQFLFAGRTPLAVMLEHGPPGLRAVRVHLEDQAAGW